MLNFSLAAKSLAAAALLTLATSAFASPIPSTSLTFGSYGGTVATSGLSNTAILFDNTQAGHPVTSMTSGTSSAISAGYLVPFAGTTFVSYDPNTETNGGDNGGLTVYSTTYTGSLTYAGGTLSVSADDSVSAYLNGTFLGSTGSASYNTPFTFNIAPGTYFNGLNTFTFNVTNVNPTNVSGGPTNFDFKATAATPEPSSMVLLGTGLLSAAGMIRRRIVR